MELYINEEGYLCFNQTVYDDKLEGGKVLVGKPIGFEQVKFKVGENGLFYQVK